MHQADEIVAKVGDLPSLPTVATKALELLRDPSVTATALEQMISRDAALASRVLRVANSAVFGLRQPVANLQRAVVVLGLGALSPIIVSAATQSLYRSKRLEEMQLWEHSLAAALAAQAIATTINHADREEAFVAGLLHDVGKVVLEQNLGDDYQAVIDQVCTEGLTFIEAEDGVLGFDHAAVGALVIQKWGLPELLEEAVRMHHDPKWAETNPTFCAVVSLANSVCVKLGIGAEKQPDLDLSALEAAKMLELDEARLSVISDELLEKLEDEAALFSPA